jgi:rhamnose transport system substrate-binding protein
MHRMQFKAGVALAAVVLACAAAACGGTVGKSESGDAASGPQAGKEYRIAMIPKFTSDPYFKAADKGAQEAAKELGVKVTFNGPVDADVSKQSEIVEQFAQQHYDAITVSANDADALAPAMEQARNEGVKVSTFDADVKPDAREVFLNQATFAGMGKTMVDMMAKQTGGKGDFLVVTAVLTAPNQNRWIEEMRKYIAAKYPDMHIKAVLPGNEDLAKSRQVALDYLRSHKDTAGVWCVTGIATPGVAEAVEKLGLKDKVVVTGLGVPSLVRQYIKSGTIKEVALWNPTDIGYAAIYMAKAQLDGTLAPDSGALKVGRLGSLKFIAPDTLLLGPPLVFDKSNIDDFTF